MRKIGVWLTSYGDEAAMTRTALTGFLATVDFPFHLVWHATLPGGMMRALREELEGQENLTFLNETQNFSLTQAFNVAARKLLENPEVAWLSSIHNDMEFPHPWMAALVKLLEADPTLGKICPINLRDGEHQLEREGNETPWVMRKEVWEQIGGCDEHYIGGGSCGDWDENRRIVNLGLKVIITPDAQVFHHAMLTRAKYGTTNSSADHHNREYYRQKWGDDLPAV